MVWSIPSDPSDSEHGGGDNAGHAEVDPWGLQSPAGSSDSSAHRLRAGLAGSDPASSSVAAIATTAASAEPDEARGQKQPAETLSTASTDVPESEPGPKRPRFDNFPLPGLRRLLRPIFTKGTEWWATPLWHSLAGHIATMPESPARPLRLESFCSGMCGEAFGVKASQ